MNMRRWIRDFNIIAGFVMLSILMVPELGFTTVPVLVKDINEAPTGSGPRDYTVVTSIEGSTIYFVAKDPLHGEELWKFDGDTPVMVKDICPGQESGQLSQLTAVGNILYFSGFDCEHGYELWRSDGTEQGTYMVKDILLLPDSEHTRHMTSLANVNGTLFFAADDGTHGYELWFSDGTELGTYMVADINPGSGSGLQHYNKFVQLGTEVFFTAYKPNTGWELWKSDGTEHGTALVADIYPGSSSNYMMYLTRFNEVLFFRASDGINGYELWTSDGTTTSMFKDINTETGRSGAPASLTVAGDLLYFAADDGSGDTLWKCDGTTAGTIPVDSNTTFSNLYDFNAVGNSIYFMVSSFSGFSELFVSDGTNGNLNSLGAFMYLGDTTPVDNKLFFTFGERNTLYKAEGTTTTSVKDIHATELTAIENILYFTGDTAENGSQVWTSDGTENGTVRKTNMYLGTEDIETETQFFTYIDDILYFAANDPVVGWQLWRSDGTNQGTTVLKKDITMGHAQFVTIGNSFFFVAGEQDHGLELWASNGTANGTRMVKDIISGMEGSDPREFVVMNGKLYFSARDIINGRELWSSDGTEERTQILTDINPGGGDSQPDSLTKVDDTIFFKAYNGSSEGLWKTDGTEPGTVLVKNTATDFYALDNLTAVGNVLYLTARGLDGTTSTGEELWKSDGTESGTEIVKDIFTGSDSSSPEYLTDVKGLLFFRADDGIHGKELWKSDGTESGTSLVHDIATGDHGDPRYLTAIGNIIFFRAFDPIHGRELWKSDGTDTGTVLVKDIFPGERSGDPNRFILANGKVYFQAYDGIHGYELWASDGSAAGTNMVYDIAPGNSDNGPYNFVDTGNLLYFLADDDLEHGYEPWVYRHNWEKNNVQFPWTMFLPAIINDKRN